VLVYATAVGLGFLFIEIAFIQAYTRFLGDPLRAAALCLATFLVAAGAGSLSTGRAGDGPTRRRMLALSLVVIVVLGSLYAGALTPVLSVVLGLAPYAKALIGAALIAPLAFAMGRPFALILAELSERDPRLVPWLWGVNGCASVIAAVLATWISLHAGLGAVLAAAVGCYVVAGTSYPSASGAVDIAHG
jgi:hypothetical protein